MQSSRELLTISLAGTVSTSIVFPNMAVFELFEVRVFSNGHPNHEYEAPNDAPKTSTFDSTKDGPLLEKYIESTADMNL